MPSAEHLGSWRPSASLHALRQRAELLRRIRGFFDERHILEVETPVLMPAPTTSVELHSMRVLGSHAECHLGYLQTSPEYAMKRLIAAGSGSIYQICKAFRDHEQGRHHQGEFTMLEWYRVGWDHHQLMDEMDDFLAATLETPRAERWSYQDLVLGRLGVCPHTGTLGAWRQAIKDHGIEGPGLESLSLDQCQTLLFTHVIEPSLGDRCPVFVYDFPQSQAQLARLSEDMHGNLVAERFEIYVRGLELANGFHELCCAQEQRARFEADNLARAQQDLPPMPLDQDFLAALEAGFPPCSGVALGVDRLAMLAGSLQHIHQTVSFASGL